MSATRKHVRKTASGRLRKSRTAAMILVAGAAAAACGTAAAAAGHGGHSSPAPSHQTGGHHAKSPAPTSTGKSTTTGHTTPTPAPAPAPAPTTAPAPPPPPPVPPAAHGVQASASQLPWSEVGTGWTLALWNEGPKTSETLFVVDPAGGRYEMATGLPAGDQIAGWYNDGRSAILTSHTENYTVTTVTEMNLVTGTVALQLTRSGWGSVQVSGDSERMIYESYASNGSTTDSMSVEEIDLASGATLGHFTAGSGGVRFTNPDGFALLESGTNSLVRVSSSGTTELSFPTRYPGGATYGGSFVESPDGATLVFGTNKGLAVVSNSGAVESELSSPVAGAACTPMRWDAEGAVLTRCVVTHGYSGTSTLWLMPVSGAAPTFVGDDNYYVTGAWQAGTGWYGQAVACGTAWIVGIGPNGEQDVQVPGTQAGTSQNILGSNGHNLEVLVTLSCGSTPAQQKSGSGTSLLWFDPATNAETVLLGPGLNGGMVDGALPYGASSYDD